LIGYAAGGAATLAQVAQSWAKQLAGFQAEADTLEKQAASAAADYEYLEQKKAVLAATAGPVALSADLDAAKAKVSQIQARARELRDQYEAAAKRMASQLDTPGVWERSEPYRKVLEGFLAPFDMAGADFWAATVKRLASVGEEWVDDFGAKVDAAQDGALDGVNIVEELKALGNEAELLGTRIDAWWAFAPKWLSTAAGNLSEIEGFSRVMGGLGIVADAGTLISPQDSGTMGDVDRAVALVNGGLLVADLAMASLPVVGEVAIAVTGAYLAGDWAYHHFKPFRDVADDVGHAVVHSAVAVAHAAEDVGHATEDVGHAASSAWHSVSSTMGSWF
jgi:hypothetical protein